MRVINRDMKRADFIAEHKRLVKVLMSGKPKEQRKEAKSQAAELKRFLKKKK